MDGATKYVKGEATAGRIITVINLVGGLLMGVISGGMNVTEALNKYALLTIGDGLVSQIPSLMISLSTGILVTKASKDSELPDEIAGELFSTPKALKTVGIALASLGIVTPLPWWLFLIIGGGLFAF